MAEDTYQKGQDMMEMDFSDLNRGRSARNGRSEKKTFDPEKGKKFLVFGGAMLCVVILIIVLILLAVDRSTKEPASPIQAQVKALEEKVARFEGIEQNIASVQGQQEALQKSIARLEDSQKSLGRDLRNVTQEIEQLKKGTAGMTTQAKKAEPVRKQVASQTRGRYHVVQKGESLYKIAVKYGMSVRDLFRLNNLTSKSVIHPGQKLVITPAGK
jgi:LysM repeat protein